MNIFLIHPTTRNIGNDVITYATAQLLYSVFGQDANIVNIPALEGHQFGGLVPRQIYDINRFADCVVLGGGNLFENGQITYNAHAVEALRPPMLLLGLSHGRIMSRRDELEERTDSLRADAIRHLVGRSVAALVRDHASQAILRDLGAPTEVGGCPTLFLEPNEEQTES
ncbi:MAG: polysaccharide pyruvyl transferase family protein, partial [Terracidiphilus sp.]